MIRIRLYSEDRKLLLLLSSALGKEFQIDLDATEGGIARALTAEAADLLVLDLDSSRDSQKILKIFSTHMDVSRLPLVVLADDGMRQAAVELVRQGAYSYCRKPPSVRELKTVLRQAYESFRLKKRLQVTQQEPHEVPSYDQMVGSSPKMRQVYDLVRKVSDINASVLVTGESGTGKELVARAIHNLGIRAGRPFVAVSCGAIPETLIEAELFGHEKGAFTGTVGLREGYLEQADDGTLFLDEIGELSLATQVKLLRVLQQREFSRLGSSRLIPLQARIVFATHANLSELVAQGKFRLDLYYRVNVMKIHLPPLQERTEDIHPLAMHFLTQYSKMYQKPVKDIHPEAMAQLQAYSWPGNVRELENIIQHAIIMAPDDTVREEDLPASVLEDSVVNIDDYHSSGSFERQLRDYKIKLAETAIRENHGNKTLAARSLQISRAYLHRLIRTTESDSEAECSTAEIGIV